MMLVPLSKALMALIYGAITSALLFAVAEASFVHALIVAVTSAFVTGIFLLISTYMNKQTLEQMDRIRLDVEANAVQAEDERKAMLRAGEQERAEIKAGQRRRK